MAEAMEANLEAMRKNLAELPKTGWDARKLNSKEIAKCIDHVVSSAKRAERIYRATCDGAAEV